MYRYITINGFMGCGKSSVGERLASRLSCGLTDLDRYIEEKSGRKIPEIFASEGEASFRRMEREALEELLDGRAAVAAGYPVKGEEVKQEAGGVHLISLGGGTVTSPECAALVKEKSVCIYLRAGIGTLVKNLQDDFASRPMLASPGSTGELRSRIEELMSRRSRIYEDTATIVIDIDGKSFDDVASEILASPLITP